MTILILGGTAEADRLADCLGRKNISFVYSLAGVTPNPKPRDYPVRRGGFGGVEGLRQALQANQTKLLIDATHPFAAQISLNATQAAALAKTPLLRLERPQWHPIDGAVWQNVATLEDAAKSLPKAAKVFLSVGAKSMAAFRHRRDVTFISRVITPPQNPFGKIIVAKPPFELAGEISLFKTNHITHLVSKNAGGAQTSAKLAAALKLDIKVIMVERPALPVAEIARNIDSAMIWIERRLQ